MKPTLIIAGFATIALIATACSDGSDHRISEIPGEEDTVLDVRAKAVRPVFGDVDPADPSTHAAFHKGQGSNPASPPWCIGAPGWVVPDGRSNQSAYGCSNRRGHLG